MRWLSARSLSAVRQAAGPDEGASLDTKTLLRIFAGCARREISRYFVPKSCIASAAITSDVMAHYQRAARPWEVCVQLMSPPYHIELGCYPSDSADDIGGHLVVLVEDAFLVDASLGQVTDANPALRVPPVFVGELMPPSGPLRDLYQFSIPGAVLQYEARSMSTDYRASLDWGPSPEREAARTAIITQIEGYCRLHSIS